MATKLYVGNLPFRVRDEDLQSLFQQAGAVQSVNIIRDKVSGQSRGFGFVEMASAEDGEKAIAALNGQEIGGRTLNINEARPKTERGGGGGGGGGRDRGGYGGGRGGHGGGGGGRGGRGGGGGGGGGRDRW